MVSRIVGDECYDFRLLMAMMRLSFYWTAIIELWLGEFARIEAHVVQLFTTDDVKREFLFEALARMVTALRRFRFPYHVNELSVGFEVNCCVCHPLEPRKINS